MADGDTTNVATTKNLTTAEIDEMKNQLVATDAEIDSQEAAKNAEAQRFTQVLKPLRKTRKQLVKAIQSGLLELEVECVENWNYKRKVIEFKDKTTGQVLDERDMAGDDLQEDITNVEGGKNKRGKRGEAN
jgi:predicted nucleotide-binding protein (sugar kinase/HSP70/actin superfamily)